MDQLLSNVPHFIKDYLIMKELASFENFTTTEWLKCFECEDMRHERVKCPHGSVHQGSSGGESGRLQQLQHRDSQTEGTRGLEPGQQRHTWGQWWPLQNSSIDTDTITSANANTSTNTNTAHHKTSAKPDTVTDDRTAQCREPHWGGAGSSKAEKWIKRECEQC